MECHVYDFVKMCISKGANNKFKVFICFQFASRGHWGLRSLPLNGQPRGGFRDIEEARRFANLFNYIKVIEDFLNSSKTHSKFVNYLMEESFVEIIPVYVPLKTNIA